MSNTTEDNNPHVNGKGKGRDLLVACNRRMHDRVAEILTLANECLVDTVHPEGYVPGQIGMDYRTFGKTIAAIRKVCGDSLADTTPDYDFIARQFFRAGFDPDRLGKAIEAQLAESGATIHDRAFYLDLAKRMERPIDEPTTVGCPSLVPGHIPSGADGAEPAPQGAPHYLEFCGMKMTAFGGAGLPTTFIGKRTHPNPTNPVQIFEIKVQRRNGISGCVAKCFENGELLFTLESDVRFSLTNTMAVKCLRAVLIERTKTNARRHRQEKRKRRAAALSPDAELAATVARQQDDDDLAQRIENA